MVRRPLDAVALRIWIEVTAHGIAAEGSSHDAKRQNQEKEYGAEDDSVVYPTQHLRKAHPRAVRER